VHTLASVLSTREPSHPFQMSEREIYATFSDPLYIGIINSPRFRRLRQIRFLGAIDYLVTANGRPLNTRHTRYQHSLGVGYLALRLARQVGWSARAERTFVAAALLHDIGHGPLSHSIEPVFRQEFSIDHHDATLTIIRCGIAGESAISALLREHQVDTDRVIDMISNREGEWSELFLGKFNLDTLEAIPRSATYVQRNAVSAPPWLFVAAAHMGESEMISTLDSFWSLKNFVYSKLIQSPVGVAADLNAQEYMRKHLSTFSREDFFLDELALRAGQAQLFRQIGAPRWDRVQVNQRRFEIRADKEDPGDRYTERRKEILIDYAGRPWGRKDVGGWEEDPGEDHFSEL